MINYELPKEVRNYVLQLQAELKIKTGNGKFSQQQTINWIIKEYKTKTEKNDTMPFATINKPT